MHSRGYHVCFDITSNNGLQPPALGYLVPAWLPRSERAPVVRDSVRAGFVTVIRLPFKQQVRKSVGNYRKQLTQIKPQLLLFLRKLDNLSIFDHLQGTQCDMQRKFSEDGRIATLTTKTSKLQSDEDYDSDSTETNGDSDEHTYLETERWLVVRKHLKCLPDIRRDENEVQSQQTQTEIAIALPLRATRASSTPDEGPPNQPVFAYLPVAEYGLRFIVQADFVVSSSRETLQENHLWNQWIADELRVLLCDAFESYKTCLLPKRLEPDHYRRSQDRVQKQTHDLASAKGNDNVSSAQQENGLREIVRFYHLLPEPRNARGLFVAVAQTMLKDIREHTIVLTSDGSWRLPAHTVVVPLSCQDLCRKLVSDRLLSVSMNLSFVHHGLLQEVPDRAILHRQLGV